MDHRDYLVDLAKYLADYREARCTRKLGHVRDVDAPNGCCDGENHVEDCAVEIAWQDVIATHDKLLQDRYLWDR